MEDFIAHHIEKESFHPIKFTDEPGYIYPTHAHPETKVLAFLAGSMQVTVEGTVYSCEAGDKLIIPGNKKHAAVVGPNGCTFFWSEKFI